MKIKEAIADVGDWDVLRRFLPLGWAEEARTRGALRRSRRIKDPDTLLRVLMIHLAAGCSLQETAVRAKEAGLASLSSVAVFKRLRASEEWLRWMAEASWNVSGTVRDTLRRPLRAVDATMVSEPGSSGGQWRIHYSINLTNLQCDFYALTSAKEGEAWRRFAVHSGDILVGDRIYATLDGVRHVVSHKGDVIVRLNRCTLPLFSESGRKIDVLRRVRGLHVGEVRECRAWVRPPKDAPIAGRLIIVKRNRAATQAARKRLRYKASKKQERITEKAWRAAAYFFLWTSLDESYPALDILDYYRLRWQIELVFKRMKSIMGLGHLPKSQDESARAWLHGKILIGLLVNRVLDAANAFFPWGYPMAAPAKPLEGESLPLP